MDSSAHQAVSVTSDPIVMDDVTKPASQIASPSADSQLIDPFGRAVDYIRISVTDRCDFRCVYCMAEEMTFLPKKNC